MRRTRTREKDQDQRGGPGGPGPGVSERSKFLGILGDFPSKAETLALVVNATFHNEQNHLHVS